MKYIEVKIYTGVCGIEHILNFLSARDIEDAVIQDPTDISMLMNKENSYDWDYIDEKVMKLKNEEPAVVVYFDCNEEGKKKLDKLKSDFENFCKNLDTATVGEKKPFGNLRLEEKYVDDEDWKDKWKEFFKPAKITDRIVIKPTWEEYEKVDDELVIEIDPGMAFGTGTHETTALCIQLIEKYGKGRKTLLDVGCGSGILSIAAGLLGVEDVLGVDIDPEAVDVACENVELNRLSKIVKIQYGDLTKGIEYKGDIVAANLMAELVMLLSKDVSKHISEDGVFISSGILVEKKELVSAEIIRNGFEIIEILEKGDWCAIAARLA